MERQHDLGMRRRILLGLVLWPHAAMSQADRMLPSSPVDAVALYVVPTDGIPEPLAANIARALTRDTGLWIKSSTWAPSGVDEPFAGTNQYAAEDYLQLGTSLSSRLPDTNARTYFIVLTDRDINSRSRNFRFQYSVHSPMARTSVLSLARLAFEADGTPATMDALALRTQKMLLRIVGEMKFGWQRSSDPGDLMYAPIMSLADIDRTSLIHTLRARKLSP